ncbi:MULTISPECIES: hypothetical protein [Nocardia]|nr:MULTISPECIES: hypothetical protein [Nocardia]
MSSWSAVSAAHDVLRRILRPDDLVLIKASRAARLEHLVAALSHR